METNSNRAGPRVTFYAHTAAVQITLNSPVLGTGF